MLDFPVRPEKLKLLAERYKRLGLREEDIEEKFIRSSGRGGQKVNKVSTCVVLLHRPTGLRVRCEEERSQALNRFKARRMLVERLEQLIKEIGGLERNEVDRIARLKHQRSRRT